MDAVKYFKAKRRMVKLDTYGFCIIECDQCGLSRKNNRKGLGCGYFENLYPEEAVAIVKKWSEEHKAKTRAEVFFERFPDAHRDENDEPRVCARTIGLTNRCPEYSCYNCWQQPAPDEYQDWAD